MDCPPFPKGSSHIAVPALWRLPAGQSGDDIPTEGGVLKAVEKTREAVGSYVAVGTFQPEIEIWNLDVMDVMEPSAILGGVEENEGAYCCSVVAEGGGAMECCWIDSCSFWREKEEGKAKAEKDFMEIA